MWKVERKQFKNLSDAIAYANLIFAKKGIVVAITEVKTP